jgi:hypothetical protein
MVGLIPLLAVEVLDREAIAKLPGFRKRMQWFLDNRKDLGRFISYMECRERGDCGSYLLAIPSRKKLEKMLRYVLDENEFLSPYGIRSLSKVHAKNPAWIQLNGQRLEVHYVPGDSDTNLFGGNSNWRGPIWFPLNYLLVEALERYHHFFGDDLKVECPTGSGKLLNLLEVSHEIQRRLAKLFTRNEQGVRPCCQDHVCGPDDAFSKDLLLFHEYFHGETGKGLGASHQTGWTALIARCLEALAQ